MPLVMVCCAHGNVKTGSTVKKFIGHKKVQFSADNRRIISCGRDNKVIHTSNGYHILFSPNVEDDVFVSVSYDKTVKVWRNNGSGGEEYQVKYELKGHTSVITSLAICVYIFEILTRAHYCPPPRQRQTIVDSKSTVLCSRIDTVLVSRLVIALEFGIDVSVRLSGKIANICNYIA